ncbi:MAG: aminopeptidase P N-terminal domain-containing protein [Planctomycetota bacterium]|jgi:Xaa-Pro aminopeptidase
MSDYLQERRDRVSGAWALDDECVLVGAGGRLPLPGSDQFFEFRCHPEFQYLADSDVCDGVLAFDPAEGWTLFVPVPDEDEQVWHGVSSGPTSGRPLAELPDWIARRRGRTFASLGCAARGADFDPDLSVRLRGRVTAARRVKDGEEQRRLRAAADATRAGFLTAFREARAGLSERALEIEMEAAFLRAGGRRSAFDSIVAGGRHAAVLHFEPTDRALEAGEFVLIDAGAEAAGYASDCTRTFVVGGRPSPEQTDLHALVLAVQEAATKRCVPGAEFKQINIDAMLQMAQGLVDIGLLKGRAQPLVERGALALFWPHGLGHLIGLCVHDAGGYAEGRVPDERPGLKWLRADLTLEAGHALTVEPGLYFIDALLDSPANRDAFAADVDWLRADALRRLGGIRIEDSVIVTDDGPEVLTRSIPKGIAVR